MATSPEHTLRRLLLEAADAGVRARLGASLILALLAAGLAALSPLVLATLVDRLPAGREGQALAPILLMQYLLVLAASRAASQLQAHFFMSADQALQRRLAPMMFHHLLRIPLPSLLTLRAGRLVQLQGQAIEGVRSILSVGCLSLVPAAVQVLAILVILAGALRDGLWLIIAGAAASYVVVFSWGVRRIARPAQMALAAQADAAGVLSDGLANAETVKSFAGEHRLAVRYRERLGEAERAWRACFHRRLETGLATGVIFLLSLGLALGFGLSGLARGSLSVGGFVLLNACLIQVIAPLESAGFAVRDLAQAIAHLKGWRDVQRLPVEPLDAGPVADTLHAPLHRPPSIRFEAVSLDYGGGRPALCDVSFEAPAGGVVAIVGPSGAGKSSLLRLLQQHCSPDAGRILLDGAPLATLSIAQARRRMAVVSQDVVLFNDTLNANLLFARPDASPDAVSDAIARSQLSRLVARLPLGFETIVGERGLSLSGGERQRLAIARALLKDADILMLDEPTSALDAETEASVVGDLVRACHGRTTLIATHRLALAAHADTILVLNAGCVVERGDHARLLRAGGLYAQLWRRQGGSALGDGALIAPDDRHGDVPN